jgi:transcription initiation factor IIE alpha subunit
MSDRQRNLFSTSQQALDSIAESLPHLRRQVWEYLLEQGERGATDEEMQDALNMNPSTQRPRRLELLENNPPLIRDSGERRPTKSGRSATVWRIAD